MLFIGLWGHPARGALRPEVAFFARADSAYRAGDFPTAADFYARALEKEPRLLARNIDLSFKVAYAYYRSAAWPEAIRYFELAKIRQKELEDYSHFFQGLAYLAAGDTAAARRQFRILRTRYADRSLNGIADSVRVEIFRQLHQPDSVRKYLKRMLKRPFFEKTGIYLNLLSSLQTAGRMGEYRRYAFKFLATYPFHVRAADVYQTLVRSYSGKMPLTDLKKLMRYLFRTSQYLSAEKLVKSQRKYAASRAEKDYLNWTPVEIAYRQGDYRVVLNWCLQQRKNFKSPAILRQIDLHIPRCYLRLGETERSIAAYLEFRRKYPRDKLAPEVLWKVAWLYENRNQLTKANRMYRQLIRVYPKSQFTPEAAFRLGLNDYRMGRYAEARRHWETERGKSRDDIQKARYAYWIGKCYRKEHQPERQRTLYLQLAQHPINSFYNLKAFYLTRDGNRNARAFSDIFWQLHHRDTTFLPLYLNRFDRAFRVKELLGDRWAAMELRDFSGDTNGWQPDYALGEVYELWRQYGKAFRKFRSIFWKYFSDADIAGLLPIFKHLYPLHYQQAVRRAAEEFGVPEPLIYSVMKKESAFESHIISYANAYGLMQLLPSTASQVAPRLKVRFTNARQLFNAPLNIRMGTYYLSRLIRRYNGNLIMALAAYNAGPHRVDRWKKNDNADDDLFMENLEFGQTRRYVRSCLRYYWIYRAILQPEGSLTEVLTNTLPSSFRP